MAPALTAEERAMQDGRDGPAVALAMRALGCRATWTDAPYQSGHRPRRGEVVAWAEGGAVAFCNSVLGARCNRQQDLSDLCAALTGRAPCWGLHLPENRRARILVDTASL